MAAPVTIEKFQIFIATLLTRPPEYLEILPNGYEKARQNSIDLNFLSPLDINGKKIKKVTLLTSTYAPNRYVFDSGKKFDAALLISFADGSKQAIGLSQEKSQELLSIINSPEFQKESKSKRIESITFDDYNPQKRDMIIWKDESCKKHYDDAPGIGIFYTNLHGLINSAAKKLIEKDAVGDLLVVDIGCGTGEGLIECAKALSPVVKNLECVGCDISGINIKQAREKLQLVGQQLPVRFEEPRQNSEFLKDLKQKYTNKKIIFTASGVLTDKVTSMQDTVKILQQIQSFGENNTVYLIASGWTWLQFNKIVAKKVGFELLPTEQSSVSENPFYLMRSLSKKEIIERYKKQLQKNPYYLDLSFSNNSFDIIREIPQELLAEVRFLNLSFCNFQADTKLINIILEKRFPNLQECILHKDDMKMLGDIPSKIKTVCSSSDYLPMRSHAKEMLFFSTDDLALKETLLSIQRKIQELKNRYIDKCRGNECFLNETTSNEFSNHAEEITVKLRQIFEQTKSKDAGIMLANIYQNGIFSDQTTFAKNEQAFDIWKQIYLDAKSPDEKQQIYKKIQTSFSDLEHAKTYNKEMIERLRARIKLYEKNPDFIQPSIDRISYFEKVDVINTKLFEGWQDCMDFMKQDLAKMGLLPTDPLTTIAPLKISSGHML